MKLFKSPGVTSEIWQVFIQDSSSAVGAGLTGLVFNTASLTAYYHRDTNTTATAITLATMTVGTFTSSGFKEIDATNMPGFYQFCPPNAALAAGAKSCGFILKGATNMAQLPIEVQLDGTALTDILSDSTAFAGANIATINGKLPTALDSSGYIKAGVLGIGGQTASAAAAVTFPATVASTTNITAGTITTVTNLTNAATSGDLTSTMKASAATAVLTTAITESIATDGAAPTLAQFISMIISKEFEMTISGTTMTCKKLDGSSTAMVFTLNDPTSPTSITRTS